MSLPLKSVWNHFFTIFLISSYDVNLAPRARMFASLCFLLISACFTEVHNAALTPFILFAAIDIPIPEPQITIPLFILLFFIALPTAWQILHNQQNPLILYQNLLLRSQIRFYALSNFSFSKKAA